MNYLDQRKLAVNQEFVNRVQQGAIEAAIAIANEGASGKSGVDNMRLQLARQILNEPAKWAQTLAYGIVAIPMENMDDLEIVNAILAVWNCYAGVNPNLVAKDEAVVAEGIVTEEMLTAAASEKVPWYKKLLG